ncbi:hypothetical protein [Eubacterium aggregans]|uniref:hypothetical protein n=1 Tax=Eubacterium aggregans TaxID=81409 RepID=UPI003F2D35DC
MNPKTTPTRSEKQCHKLFISELVTAFICGYIIYGLAGTLETGLDLRLIIPGAILIFVLLQGTAYWYCRRQEARSVFMDRPLILKIFALLKKATHYVLCLYPLLIIYLLLREPQQLWVPFNVFGTILWAFALIEFTNNYYFSVRLGNLKHRTPSDLALELDAESHRKGVKK